MKLVRGCLLAVLLGLVFGVATYFKAGYRDSGRPGLALLSVGLGFLVVRGCGGYVRRHFAMGSATARESDPRPPILFLRSFARDGRFKLRGNAFAFAVLGAPTLEQVLVRDLSNFGPVVAIGRPGEKIAPDGAFREYVDHDTWRERVRDLIADAQLIVVLMDETSGLQEEYGFILDLEVLDRCLFVAPPVGVEELTLIGLRFRQVLESKGRELSRPLDGDVVMIAADELGRLAPISSPGLRTRSHPLLRSVRYYADPLRTFLDGHLKRRRPVETGRDQDPSRGRGMSPNAADSTVSSAWSATYARRSMAFMMDGLLAFYVPAFFAIVLGVVVTQRAEMTEDEATEVVTVAAVLTGMAGLILHPVLFEGFFRRGPGKSVFGLHVVDTELRATTLRQRLVRALIKSLSLATCCLPAVALLAFAPQSLHDRAAETILIRKRGPLK